MLTGIGAFVTGVAGQLQTAVLPVLILVLVFGGFKYMTGDHQGGRQWITGGLGGAAVALLANVIAAGAVALVPHG